MIPKIIHYCWLSNDKIPSKLNDYMKTWDIYLPDYEKKEKRNKIYRFCGWGMVAAMAAMLLGTYLAAHYKKYFEMVFECICGNRFCCLEFLMTSHVWLFEMIALTFFGVSFLTKANSFVVLHCDECERKRKLSFWLEKIKRAIQKVS